MTPERWAEVNDVLHRAMQLAPEQRSAFLDSACASDLSLQREVESLLSASDQVRSSFLESPPDAELARGTRLGDYEIQSLLGSGGMGEVYRARDLRLRREVAIKVLPPFVSNHPDRLRRFEQEAMAAAALNHPNILAVFQMGTHEGAPYLVSELLEGETLREQMKCRRLPLRKAIDFGIQIARGLAAAHEKGIVHRDLKPENLFVTIDGRVKILDFGLAKLKRSFGTSPNSALTVASETEPGVVMGTVGYMSPEQVRGKAADDRGDIFAFGVILYEMLTRQRAFQKPTSAETMNSILNEDPTGISQFVPTTPSALQRVVHRCLEKSPEQRFQSALDLAFALEALSDSGSTSSISNLKTSKSWPQIVVGGTAVLLLLGLAFFSYRHSQAKKLISKDTIVLADFVNQTSDPAFDDALRQELIMQLEQSPFFNVLSDRKMSETLKLMGRSVTERVTPDIADEICLRTGSKAVLSGSISTLGQLYLVGLNTHVCQSGDVLAVEQEQAGSKEQVLKALAVAATAMRAKLGESLASIQEFELPLGYTTSSLPALKAFAVGRTTLSAGSSLDAIPFFKQAIELDPDFAEAYLYLGKMYLIFSQEDAAKENFTTAYRLRSRVSEIEAFDISTMYFEYVTGELDRAIETYKEWIHLYPHNAIAPGNLGELYVEKAGRYDEAVEAYRKANTLDPAFAYGYTALADVYIALNRLADAKAAIDEMKANRLDPEVAWDKLYAVAFLQNDRAEMERQLAAASRRPDAESDCWVTEASTDAYHGQFEKARDLLSRAVVAQKRTGRREAAARNQIIAALEEALAGDMSAANQLAGTSVALYPNTEVKTWAAATWGLTGASARAESISSELEKGSPVNTLLINYWLPAIRASIKISEHKPAEATVVLQPTENYELAFEGLMYAVYVRGEAYLAMHNADAAATEFQKIVEHPGIVRNHVIGVLAHLELGRAYAVARETAKARTSYQEFLRLWKDADPGVPVLQQAKAEYSKLNDQ